MDVERGGDTEDEPKFPVRGKESPLGRSFGRYSFS
jgi:hypothetical protein